jgi:hypothetical protein
VSEELEQSYKDLDKVLKHAKTELRIMVGDTGLTGKILRALFQKGYIYKTTGVVPYKILILSITPVNDTKINNTLITEKRNLHLKELISYFDKKIVLILDYGGLINDIRTEQKVIDVVYDYTVGFLDILGIHQDFEAVSQLDKLTFIRDAINSKTVVDINNPEIETQLKNLQRYLEINANIDHDLELKQLNGNLQNECW